MKDRNCSSLMRCASSLQRLFFLALLSIIAIGAYAQGKTVSGTVLDKSGESVIGASVVVKGTTNGTITDFDGKFTLSNVPNDASLEISFVGFKTQVIPVQGKTTFNVTMVEDTEVLDEVVVVGYGVQKKSDVTGAMARVGEKELKAMPVKNALEGMQGKTAGVDITSSQRPGEVGSINIRGVRSITADQGPLYVVDGMIIQNGGIENINPSDIESIDVLKDASATAIYGSRGANGVILVTTKKGKEGKISLNYSGTVTFETLHDVTEMMSASEWLDYARLAKYNMGSYASATPDYEADKAAFGSVAASWANIEKAWEGGTYDPSKVGSYDWASNGKQTGITHEHTLSASGGTDKFQGYASFGYLNQKGTQPGQAYERYTLKTSFDASPLSFFKMGSSINASYSDQDYGYSFTKSVTGSGDLYGALRSMLPWTVPYDENGEYIRNPNGDVNIINPIRELDYNTNQRRTFRANASMYAQVDFGKIWEPLEGLSYRIQFGPEFQYYTLGIANAADAITWINKLRDRAAYKEGEDRSVNVDGGQSYKNNTYCAGKGGGYSADGAIYSEQNTYYESNNLEGQESVYNAQSSLSGMHLNSVNDVYNSQTDAPIYQALNCTSNAEKMMCFLLNERTRELCGEGYRWEDLARTKTLDARWHAFNDGVSRGIGEFNPDKHYYRPIPQSFLDGITNESGAALTNEEKQAMQNPGY